MDEIQIETVWLGYGKPHRAGSVVKKRHCVKSIGHINALLRVATFADSLDWAC